MVKITRAAKKVIEDNPVALSTLTSGGKPNVIAVACVKVVSDNKVVITDNFMKRTRMDLKKNKNVCLAVWDKDWNGYKLIGTAEYHCDGIWKALVENMPENKGLPAKGAIVVTVSTLLKLS